jgi:hypothetical protein
MIHREVEGECSMSSDNNEKKDLLVNTEENTEAEPEVNAEDDANADAEAEPEVNAEDDANADAEAEPEVNAEDDADADAEAEPEVNAEDDANAEVNRSVDGDDGGNGGNDENPEEDDVAQPWYSNRQNQIAGGIGLLALLLIIGLATMSGNKDTAEVTTADTTTNNPFNLALAPVPDCQYRGVVIRSNGSEVFRAKGGFVGNGCPAVIGAPKFLQDGREKTLLHAHPSNDGTLYVSFTNGIDWHDTQSTQLVAVYTGK